MAHLLKVAHNRRRGRLNQYRMTLLKHPLDNPAAVLVETILNNILFDLLDEINEGLRVRLLAHLLDYLLHHMVSIEVKRTILDLF